VSLQVISKFLSLLKEYTLANPYEKKNEIWDVKGILEKHSNREFKFDLRPIQNFNNDLFGKKGSTKTKADKMVFNTKDKWIVVDIEELHNYLKNEKIKIIYLDKILSDFDWNIIINK
jgi:hypothetical protein